MSTSTPHLKKDPEDIVNKFGRLIEQAASLHNLDSNSPDKTEKLVRFREVRASALNLLSRVASSDSVYYRELAQAEFTDHLALRGILQAAMTDFREGFMVDAKLLVSAEVYADFLVQAEVLLEHDYKDAAAVVIRAVLEDGLRKVCASKGIVVKERDGIDRLAEAMIKNSALTGVQFQEVKAKKEIGNKAAHGKFNEYTKADVVAFLEFVQRLLATLI